MSAKSLRAGGLLAGLVSASFRAAPVRLESLDDAQLVARVVDAGDEAAFAVLVRRHEARVRGLLLRLTRGDRTLADDLGQEVFLRAYRGLPRFEGRARFSTWLYRIAYNVFLNHRSRHRPHVALPEDFEPVQLAAPGPGGGAAGFELRRDLEGAIAQLPDRYRSVVTLYYLEDVSYPEIAQRLELPLGTVKIHLHRARKQLRGLLPSWDPDEVQA